MYLAKTRFSQSSEEKQKGNEMKANFVSGKLRHKGVLLTEKARTRFLRDQILWLVTLKDIRF